MSEVHPLRASMNRQPDASSARVQRTRTWDQPNATTRIREGGGGPRSARPMLVLYALVGEEPELVEDPKRQPDANWNAFALAPRADGGAVTLADVQRAFPLGDSFHFSFHCDSGTLLDLTNPRAAVPYWDGKIVARVTPLEDPPVVEVVGRLHLPQQHEELVEDEAPPRHVGERPRHHSDYLEFESTCESQDEEAPDDPVIRGESRDWDNAGRRGYQQQQGGPAPRMVNNSSRRGEERYGDNAADNSGAGRAPDWSDAGKDAQAFLRKQTEQAYDFAKKISIEDAKKGASETAKKAKKWGGSLLSSISASISNAASAVKSDTIQVGGLTVNVVRLIADGGYAQVLLVRSAASNEMFALKRVICQSQEVHKDVQTELQVLQAVKHNNVVPLIEFAESRQQNLEFYFLFPYFERGSLWDAIEAARNSSSPLWPFTQHAALHLFHGICSGVLALHRAGFCHRDLKPHNVMLTSASQGEDFLQYIPVLCDFGSCTGLRVEIRSRASSLDVQDEANRKSSAPYRAPELFEPTVDTAIDGQSDVWSLGCMLYAMAFGTSPFEHPREGFMKLACMNGRVSFPPEQNGMIRHRSTQFTTEFCDFIRDMLHTNPEERPSALDALEFTEELLQDELRR